MMAIPAKVFQPNHFDSFRCIGAACEDTCCVGWIVHVDKATYGKYQACADPRFGSSMQALIHINAKSASDDDFAAIALNGATCPFLCGGICSIQQRLGEGYLSNMCATYPRVMNTVDDVLHRSLDISCPEAARVVLLNPRPMEFENGACQKDSIRPGNIPSLDISSLKTAREPYRLFRDIQRHVISLLQDRSLPIWKRLFIVGRFCERLDEAGAQSWDRDIVSLRDTALADLGAKVQADRKVQLETVLELIVARITSDSNPRRFLECYKEFMDGIQWTSKSKMNEMSAHYAEALTQHYAPFMARNEHMLEHYLVSYAHKTLFPFGVPESNHKLCNGQVPSVIAARYMLMVAYYAITRTLLIGSAGFHKSAFDPGHALKAIQSCAKTFEHSVTYPGRVIGMLAGKSMTDADSLCILAQH